MCKQVYVRMESQTVQRESQHQVAHETEAAPAVPAVWYRAQMLETAEGRAGLTQLRARRSLWCATRRGSPASAKWRALTGSSTPGAATTAASTSPGEPCQPGPSRPVHPLPCLHAYTRNHSASACAGSVTGVRASQGQAFWPSHGPELGVHAVHQGEQGSGPQRVLQRFIHAMTDVARYTFETWGAVRDLVSQWSRAPWPC